MADDVVTQKLEQEKKDLEKLKGKMNRIRETNSSIIGEIESMGQGVDLSIPRLEHFMVFMVDQGLITEAQMIESQYLWEKNLKEQLVVIVRTLRERRAASLQEARRRQREADKEAKKPVKIHGNDQNGKPAELVLPPGVKFDKVVEDGEDRETEAQEEA